MSDVQVEEAPVISVMNEAYVAFASCDGIPEVPLEGGERVGSSRNRPRASHRSAYSVALLGGFRCESDGCPVQLSVGTQRIVAFLAIFGSPQTRSFVAGSLWPEASDGDARAALRKQLWRVCSFYRGLIEADRMSIWLGPDVTIDLHAERAAVNRLLFSPVGEVTEPELDTILHSEGISRDLLQGWYEDWVIVDQERWRQLRVHALERASEASRVRGRWSAAVDTALAAAAVDPFRESAVRLLVEALAAEGNVLAAARSFKSFQSRVRAELGVDVSPEFRDRIVSLIAGHEELSSESLQAG